MNCGPGSTLTSLSHEWLQKHPRISNGTISARHTAAEQLFAAEISPGSVLSARWLIIGERPCQPATPIECFLEMSAKESCPK